MNIWLISAFEPTPVDKSRPMRFMGIAQQAVKEGHLVTFFSTTFNHYLKKHRYSKNTYLEIQERYSLILLYCRGYKKNISFSRMFSHYEFAIALIKEFERQKEKPDIIFISLPPISSVYEVCKWAKKNKIAVVVDIIDPWPDVFLNALPAKVRVISRVALFPFYIRLRNILEYTSGISAISSAYIYWAQTFTKKFVPAKVFYPAVDFNTIQGALSKLGDETVRNHQVLRVIYTGSLASSYDIKTILDAAEILDNEMKGAVRFAIAGTGPKAVMIQQKVEKLDCIEYLGWIGQEDLYRQYSISDLGLTQHTPGATQSVTYKFFDYLSAGLPILNSLEGEMAHLIDKYELGLNNTSGNARELATNISTFVKDKNKLAVYKMNALTFAKEQGNSSRVYHELLCFLQDVAKETIFVN
jgi:glycosyltransferase involved in cell wall biosynthesis